MTSAATSSKPSSLRDWLAPRARRVAVPSWLASLVLHGLFVFLAFQVASWQTVRPDTGGTGGGQLREVGIHIGEPEGGAGGTGDTPPPPVPEAGEGNPADAPLAESPLAAPVPSLSSTAPPIPLSLPDAAPPVIGSNPLGGRPATGFGETMLRPRSGTGATGTGRPGGGGTDGVGFSRGSGGTSFIGIGDRGRRFVYLIDRSGSMADHDAFLAAKSEVLASIEQLDEKQQFQVIFYNNVPLTLRTRDDRIPMFTGTDANRLQVAEQRRSIEPRDGTLYMPAILKGLEFQPDVIYFLTDGIDPELSPNQFAEKVRTRNQGGAHIHCIEFGDGPSSKVGRTGNFLVKLAEANHGQYVYRDVTAFRRRP
jgi:hypothetical protein